MKTSSVRNAIGSMIMVIGFSVALPASAEMGGGMMGGQQGSGAGAQQMSGLMRDMSGQMMSMSGEMGKGMMMDAPQQQQMDEMRKQMDGMMQGSPMAPR